MPVFLNPKLTDAGKAAAVNATANGLQLQITHVALGTGKYDSAVTGAAKTTMVGRREQVRIGAGVVTGAGGFRINVLFNAWTPTPYNVSEVGFYAGDPAAGGVLFAVWSHASDILVQRNTLDYVASFNLQITDVPVNAITIVMDPNAAQALVLLYMHENATDPHKVYVKKAGDLSTGIQRGVTPAYADISNALATTAYANRMGVNYPSIGGEPVTVGMAPGAGGMGRWYDIQANGAAIFLPDSREVPVGAAIEVRCTAPSGAIVAWETDRIYISPLAAPGPKVVQIVQGETMTITRNEIGQWHALSVATRVPAGTLAFIAGTVAPPGYLKLNGALLPRESYPALWGFAQNQGLVTEALWTGGGYWGRFSHGSNGADFRIPDSRGVFLRSLDEGRGIDLNRGWGTFQDQDNRAHAHGVNDYGHAHGVYDPGHGHAVRDPGHLHSAWTDGQGDHAHQLNTEGVAAGTVGVNQGALHAGLGKISSLTTTAGNHGHNVGIGASATDIGIYAGNTNVSIYAANTGISLVADGSEARPKNLAFTLCIKF